MRRFQYRLYVLLMLVSSAFYTKAQTWEYPTDAILSGSNLVVGDTCNQRDPKFGLTDYSTIITSTNLVRNNIILEIDPTDTCVLPDSFSIQMVVTVVWTDSTGTVNTDIKTLRVKYNNSLYAKDTLQSYYSFFGGHIVNVTITSINAIGISDTLPDCIRLVNQMVISRNYLIVCGFSVLNVDTLYQSYQGELTVSWQDAFTSQLLSGDEYDLEWTFYDDSSDLVKNFVYNSINPYSDEAFFNNATRVSIKGTQYNIPLLYDSGFLMFRIRPVRLLPNDIRVPGLWTTDYSGGGVFIYHVIGHEPNLNWQAKTSFAEEGKRKSVVSYYDGASKNRQTVTKINSDNIAVVAETIYDWEGRPIINTLPAPTIQSLIKHFKKFNTDMVDSSYSWHDIDSNGACNPTPKVMNTDSGSSRYYSANNPLRNTGFNQFIPDAFGYPFSETQYTNDLTNRVRRSSGPGKDHKMGTDHITTYYYGAPGQSELNRLFGPEVGISSHYFKNLVVDANEQISVTYQDMHGRTIATALAGYPVDTPYNLDTLPEYRSDTTLYDAILDTTNNFIDGTSITCSKTILASSAGTYKFYYNLFPQTMLYGLCHSTQFCFQCVYDLSITVTDDCNNNHLPGGQPYVRLDSNYSFSGVLPYYFDTICGDSVPPIIDSFSLNLPVGEYTITKVLSINQNAINFYYNYFLRTDTCLQTFNDFYQAALSQIDTSGCNVTCASCLQKLGDSATFCSNYLTNLIANDSTRILNAEDTINAYSAYSSLKSSCDLLCDSFSICEQNLNLMLADMSPGGQYATDSANSITGDIVSGGNDSTSIFYSGLNGVDSLVFGRHLPLYSDPTIVYLNSNNQPDTIIADLNNDGVLDTTVPNNLSIKQFIAFWKPSWANALVKYHPEYCYYQYCVANNASNQYDEWLRSISSYDTALYYGLMNPLNMSTAISGFGPNTSHTDPFFDPSAIGYPYLANFENNAMINYADTGGIPLSIWQVATIALACRDSSDPSRCLGCQQNYYWSAFRSMYLGKKKILQDSVMQIWALTNCNSDMHPVPKFGPGGTLHYTNKAARFVIVTNQSTPISVSNPGDSASVVGVADSLGSAGVEFSCSSYAQYWWDQLGKCGLSSSDSIVIINELISVCDSGTDAGHPYGASSTRSGVVTPNGNTTFEGVLSWAGNGTTLPDWHYTQSDSCTSYLITNPLPNSSTPMYYQSALLSTPNSCSCQRINAAYSQYQLSGSSGTFANYLYQTDNIVITDEDINILIKACDSSLSCNVLPHPITLPIQFDCSVNCVNCYQIIHSYNLFLQQFPGVYNSTQYLTLLQSYLNSSLGMNLTAGEYLNFMYDSCHYTNFPYSDTVPCNCDSSGGSMSERSVRMRSKSSSNNPITNHSIEFNSEKTKQLIQNPLLDSKYSLVGYIGNKKWINLNLNKFRQANYLSKFNHRTGNPEYIVNRANNSYQNTQNHNLFTAHYSLRNNRSRVQNSSFISLHPDLNFSLSSSRINMYSHNKEVSKILSVSEKYNGAKRISESNNGTNNKRFFFLPPSDYSCDSLISIMSMVPGLGTANFNPNDLVAAMDTAFGSMHYDSAYGGYIDNNFYYWFERLQACGVDCMELFNCKSIDAAFGTLGSFASSGDTITYSLPLAQVYLGILFPNFQELDGPGRTAILSCCHPSWINFSDTILSSCDSALLLSGIASYYYNGDSCLPAWAYNALLSGLWDSTINQLCAQMAACDMKCLPYCTPSLASHCDSINSVYHTYQLILSSGSPLGRDSAVLLQDLFEDLFGYSESGDQIISQIRSCDSIPTTCDTALMAYSIYLDSMAVYDSPDSNALLASIFSNAFGRSINASQAYTMGIECTIPCDSLYGLFAAIDTVAGSYQPCVPAYVVSWTLTLATGGINLSDQDICSLMSHCGYPCPDTCSSPPLNTFCDSLLAVYNLTEHIIHLGLTGSDTMQPLVNSVQAILNLNLSYDSIISMVASCQNPTTCDTVLMAYNIYLDSMAVYDSPDPNALLASIFSNAFGRPINASQAYTMGIECTIPCDSLYGLFAAIDTVASSYQPCVPAYVVSWTLNLATGGINLNNQDICSLMSHCGYPCSDTCASSSLNTFCDSIVAVYNFTEHIIHLGLTGSGTMQTLVNSVQAILNLNLSYDSIISMVAACDTLTCSATDRVEQQIQVFLAANPEILYTDQPDFTAALYHYLDSVMHRDGLGTDWCAFLSGCGDTCPQVISGPLLCNRPLLPPVTSNYNDSCLMVAQMYAYDQAAGAYSAYLANLQNSFINAYVEKCLGAYRLENFDYNYPNGEYHYTLYYYDQAGNLVKTIPPDGVDLYTQHHTMATRYRYNTLNQVVEQMTPDAGRSLYWYDLISKLTFSQNAKQKPLNQFSYTNYDPLQRITEVGQLALSITPPTYGYMDTVATDTISWYGLVSVGLVPVTQVTHTYYDYDTLHMTDTLGIDMTQYMRNRISSTTYADTLDVTNIHHYQSASHYRYDVHGNVNTLVQEDTRLRCIGQSYKRLDYDYDLISGKVNTVMYQQGYPDMFIHSYLYDADNRLTDVMTSHDSILWAHDAGYTYYHHGPLARMVLGGYEVQGLDYAYTIQGWLKGVNGDSLGTTVDMGHDGAPTGSNHIVSRDQLGYTLGYYTGDYQPIAWGSGGTLSAANTIEAAYSNIGIRSLYNGNISHMAVNIGQLDTPMEYRYHYDQLNRITAMDAFMGLTTTSGAVNWSISTPMPDYAERVSYDPNGNILSYLRNGTTTPYGGTTHPLAMDSLNYWYKPGTNQLDHVTDAVPASNYTEDIDNQLANNYHYDAIGNLTRDSSEGIDSIMWTVYGKIWEIDKHNGDTIRFAYDPSGNRIMKAVYRDTLHRWKNTYYVHDATGNIMATYQWLNMDSFRLDDVPIYGSSRLGSWSPDLLLAYTDPGSGSLRSIGSATSGIGGWTGGLKVYELNNHLGNVLSTISDRKLRVYSSGAIDHYLAEVITATDYYPFGMPMLNRQYGASYRFGFNGKEQDNEVEGKGNILDFGARIYDSRLGRWFSVDPLKSKFSSVSPFNYALNNPINASDPTGKDVYLVIWATYDGKIGHAGIAVDNYKDVAKTVTDAHGNVTTVTEHVKDGTVTYYDLWPSEPVGASNALFDVKALYPNYASIVTQDLPKTDVTGNEGSPPDGVVRLTTDYSTDQKTKANLEKFKANHEKYNVKSNNCSDMAACGVESAIKYRTFDVTQPESKMDNFKNNSYETGTPYENPKGTLQKKESITFLGLKSTTPNQLYKSTVKQGLNATVIKDPGDKVNHSFKEGSGN